MGHVTKASRSTARWDQKQRATHRPRWWCGCDRLALVARGRTNAALAEELIVSPKTVEGQHRSVFTKLAGAGSRS
jgi:FixJ family two-component response regulator